MRGEEPTAELVAVVDRAASLLGEIYTPAGALIYWSSRNKLLDGKRPSDLYAARDIEALTKMCNRLDAYADGNFG